MRKFILVLLMLPVVFLNSEFSRASDIGMPLGESEIYNFLTLQSGNLLKDMIILPEKKFDEAEVEKIVRRMDLLPKSMLSEANEIGVKIILFQGKLTDFPYMAHLKGKIPRGHPGTTFWDDLPGAGGAKYVFVKIGASEKGNGHGSVNLEYHELAHTIQNFLYTDELYDKRITHSWETEADLLFPNRDYFLNYKEEFFAECFALYFYSDVTRHQLKVKAPEMYNFLMQEEHKSLQAG